MTAPSVLQTWLSELRRLLGPLLDAADDPQQIDRLLTSLGWELGPVGTDLGDLLSAVTALDAAFVGIADAFDGDSGGGDGPDLAAIVAGLERAAAAMAQLRELPTELERLIQVALDAAAREALAVDLVEYLLIEYLTGRAPVVYRSMRILGLVRDEPFGELSVAARTVRRPVPRRRLALDTLPTLLSDPVPTLQTAHGIPAGLPDAAAAVAVTEGLLRELEALVHRLGGRALAGARDQGNPAATGLTAVFALPVPDGPGLAVQPLMGGSLGLIPADGTTVDGRPGPAVELRPFGAVGVDLPLGRWDLRLEVDGTPGTLVADPGSIRPAGGGEFRVSLRLSRPADAGSLGSASGPRLEPGAFAFEASLVVGGTDDVVVLVDLPDARLVVQGGQDDGFLGRVLPPEGVVIPFGFSVGWSRRSGLRFSGGAGLELRLRPRLSLLGVLTLDEVRLAVRAGPTGLELAAVGSVSFALGPVHAAVEQVGLGATIAFPAGGGNAGVADVALGISGPRGAGLSIRTGPVSGGGYLFFDPDRGEYAGVLELSFAVLNLKAIGLLTTKLPDGRPGFSLLLIITAEFPPIQLGFGFALTGVGGLLGINRTMNLDALRDGVRTRALDSILFPVDPVQNAPTLITNLRTVFPPAEGRYTLGPMVRIAWGPTSILEFEAAVVLELPSPLRLVVLGRLTVALPDRRAPIVQLSLHVVGILDLGRGELSVDASLFDSRVAAFPISGDMALRVGWGASKQFALAAGGFHPRFPAPPGFPTLRRLAISLCEGDNPRLRITSYFALTSTSLQFGGGIELYAELETFLGTFSVSAQASLDALIGEPFGFLVDLTISVDVNLNGNPVLHALLRVSLEGPSPWRAYGYAEVSVLLFRGRIAFDHTFGAPLEQPPAQADLWPELLQALQAPDAWSAQPPATGAADVTLRPPTGTDGLLVHPLGRLSVRQRSMPLGVTITKFGAATPSGPDVAFRITALTVGRAYQPEPPPLQVDFAVAQFVNLPADQQLSRPAFEQFPAGASGQAADWQLPVDAADKVIRVGAEADYDVAVIDLTPTGPQRRKDGPTPPPSLEDVLRPLLGAGPAAHGPTRIAADPRAGGPDSTVGVHSERYVVAGKDSLPLNDLTAPGRATAYTVAAGQRGPRQQLVTVAEVNRA